MAEDAGKMAQTQPNFLKQLKKNTHVHQAINHAYKLDYRHSISIESDHEGRLAAAGGLRHGSQLPFLISKASNFFQATQKPLNPKLSTKNSKTCSLKRAGNVQFNTIRGRTNKEMAKDGNELEEQGGQPAAK